MDRKKGKGWWGESARHSKAAKRGKGAGRRRAKKGAVTGKGSTQSMKSAAKLFGRKKLATGKGRRLFRKRVAKMR